MPPTRIPGPRAQQKFRDWTGNSLPTEGMQGAGQPASPSTWEPAPTRACEGETGGAEMPLSPCCEGQVQVGAKPWEGLPAGQGVVQLWRTTGRHHTEGRPVSHVSAAGRRVCGRQKAPTPRRQTRTREEVGRQKVTRKEAWLPHCDKKKEGSGSRLQQEHLEDGGAVFGPKRTGTLLEPSRNTHLKSEPRRGCSPSLEKNNVGVFFFFFFCT